MAEELRNIIPRDPSEHAGSTRAVAVDLLRGQNGKLGLFVEVVKGRPLSTLEGDRLLNVVLDFLLHESVGCDASTASGYAHYSDDGKGMDDYQVVTKGESWTDRMSGE